MMPRLWHSKNPPQVLPCPRCSSSFIKRSPRQIFCTRLCQSRTAEEARPPRVYRTPEYDARQKLKYEGLKKCKECKEIFDISMFWDVGGAKSARCKTCAAARQKLLRKPDTNAEGNRKRSKKWRSLHPELFKQRIRDWNVRHPDNRAIRVHRRRVKQTKNGIFTITPEDLRRLFVQQLGVCYLCGLLISGRKELDHIFPIIKGGRHSIGNVAWTHPKCNRDKHAKLLVEVRYGKR